MGRRRSGRTPLESTAHLHGLEEARTVDVTSLGGGDGGNTTSHHALPRHGDTHSPEGVQHDARRLSGAGTRHDCADLSVLDEERCIVRPSGVQDHSRIDRVTCKALRVQLDDLQGPASIIISLSTIISATCYSRSSRKVRVAIGGASFTSLDHHPRRLHHHRRIMHGPCAISIPEQHRVHLAPRTRAWNYCSCANIGTMKIARNSARHFFYRMRASRSGPHPRR